MPENQPVIEGAVKSIEALVVGQNGAMRLKCRTIRSVVIHVPVVAHVHCDDAFLAVIRIRSIVVVSECSICCVPRRPKHLQKWWHIVNSRLNIIFRAHERLEPGLYWEDLRSSERTGNRNE